MKILLICGILLAAGALHAQTVKPALPVIPMAPTTHGQTVHPAFTPPDTEKRLRRRFFDVSGNIIATCDATDDRSDHQRCDFAPGRTLDDVLDTFDKPIPPCADPKLNSARLRR